MQQHLLLSKLKTRILRSRAQKSYSLFNWPITAIFQQLPRWMKSVLNVVSKDCMLCSVHLPPFTVSPVKCHRAPNHFIWQLWHTIGPLQYKTVYQESLIIVLAQARYGFFKKICGVEIQRCVSDANWYWFEFYSNSVFCIIPGIWVLLLLQTGYSYLYAIFIAPQTTQIGAGYTLWHSALVYVLQTD